MGLRKRWVLASARVIAVAVRVEVGFDAFADFCGFGRALLDCVERSVSTGGTRSFSGVHTTQDLLVSISTFTEVYRSRYREAYGPDSVCLCELWGDHDAVSSIEYQQYQVTQNRSRRSGCMTKCNNTEAM